MRRYNLVSLAAVAAVAVLAIVACATALIARYVFELDTKSVLFAVGVVLSLTWNILNTIGNRNVEKTIRERDITFREFENIVASPLRKILRELMDLSDNLLGLFEVEDQQDKIKQTEKMNMDIFRRLNLLRHECMRIDALESQDFGDEWTDLDSKSEGYVFSEFRKALNAADEDAFIEGVSNVQASLSDLNASMQHEIYERFRAIG